MALALVALSLASCSDSRTQILVVGSSTLFPFTTAVAENFHRHYPEFLAPIVESTGTGGGIKLFCSGPGSRFPDIVNASRRMKRSELESCHANGVGDILELEIGIDGVVLVQGRNAPPLRLSLVDVYRALAATPFGAAQQALTWPDVDPALRPGPIRVIGPSPTSGTRDAFNELYMEAGCDTEASMRALKAADQARHLAVCGHVREDGAYVEAGENDNLIVQKLSVDPTAIGILGYSYLEQNLDSIKGVAVDGVEATAASISDRSYPAARALYLYVKVQHLQAIHGLAEFLGDYLAESTIGPGGYLARRGLVPSPATVRAAGRARLQAFTPLRPEELQ